VLPDTHRRCRPGTALRLCLRRSARRADSASPGLDSARLGDSGYASHSTPACPSPKVTSNATALRAIIPPGRRSVRFATPGHDHRWSAPTMEERAPRSGTFGGRPRPLGSMPRRCPLVK